MAETCLRDLPTSSVTHFIRKLTQAEIHYQKAISSLKVLWLVVDSGLEQSDKVLGAGGFDLLFLSLNMLHDFVKFLEG